MQPNEIYLKYFPAETLFSAARQFKRSGGLKIGSWLAVRKVIRDCKLDQMLSELFPLEDTRMILDLAVYRLFSENWDSYYFPRYTYEYPLFTEGMRIESSLEVSNLLSHISDSKTEDFFKSWNVRRGRRKRVWLSFGAADKSHAPGELTLREEILKEDERSDGSSLFQYALCYDCANREPLFYGEYTGNLWDTSPFRQILSQAEEYGYRNVGVLLDRGTCSRKSIEYLKERKIPFLLLVNGSNEPVRSLVLNLKETFENRQELYLNGENCYAVTLTRKLFSQDTDEVYFHLYFSPEEARFKRERLDGQIRFYREFIRKYFGEEFSSQMNLEEENPSSAKEAYDSLSATKEGILRMEREKMVSGYFGILTSYPCTAEEALRLISAREDSASLFCGDKHFLTDRMCERYQPEEEEEEEEEDPAFWDLYDGEPMYIYDFDGGSKLFIEFLSLIIRNRIHTCLYEKLSRRGEEVQDLSVQSALRILDRIELTRQPNGRYLFIGNPVFEEQRVLLKAFGMDAEDVKREGAAISQVLMEN